VTRAADVVTLTGALLNLTQGTNGALLAQMGLLPIASGGIRIVGSASTSKAPMYVDTSTFLGSWNGAAAATHAGESSELPCE
jgi:hypothetical protein